MKASNLKNKDELRGMMQKALENNDIEAFAGAFDEMLEAIGEDIRAEYDSMINASAQKQDNAILNARGIRQLTSEEKKYYQALAQAMKAKDPRQAVSNLDVVMPETVINSVFDELTTEHPLLSEINFVPTSGAIKMLINTNGYETATWGALCAEIVKELTSGFDEVDTGLFKLSAFIPVCKAMLELGPEWLDRYVRAILYEALANGLEYGIVDGTGKTMPIGMDRQVGEDVTVVSGVYPKKVAITVNKLDAATIGNLLSLMSMNNGKVRPISNVILLVNPADYFSKVMPATTLMAPDGTYRNDTLPYPMKIIQSPAVPLGEAIIGLGKRYFAAAGIGKDGRIEYSDDYHFLEDERVYLIKTYANGMPLDNNAFQLLDISDLKASVFKVEDVSPVELSDDATLSALGLSGLTLSPAFDDEEDEYTATTTDASNIIYAIPTEASATISIDHNGTAVQNGAAITWATGVSASNVVTVTVTAEDGETKLEYEITVTKS